ncbi:hypothetical protein [Ekhidna sp.]|uniref:TPR end-of-group domain-containing protein n=1 Tax=Ekhidna sp. TaxID=2608089 RepID=UPI0035122EE5
MRIIIYSFSIFLSVLTYSQSIREIYQEGIKAYEEKNYTLFNEKMFTIDTMRPNYPAVVYNLAGSYALIGNTNQALETLNKYILMDATQDFSQDSDFASLLETEGFKEVTQKQKELTETIEVMEVHQFPILTSHPESITYSKKQRAFFMGGVRDGNIWKIKPGSLPELWVESPKNSWAVMGAEVSADEKYLWVCTSSMNNYHEYNQNEEGFASVIKYDIRNRKALETFYLTDGHNFGDLISDNKGNVYISDGTANKLYWISVENGKLEEFVDLSKTVFNLQGLALNTDQTDIYLSDYIDGIYKVNIATKNTSKLAIEGEDILIKGIDGLYFKDNSLIGLHNGSNPNRVIRYQLSEDGNAIIRKDIIAQGGLLGEPTQGTWIDGTLYYIVNSPWGAYDRDGNFAPSGENIILGKAE